MERERVAEKSSLSNGTAGAVPSPPSDSALPDRSPGDSGPSEARSDRDFEVSTVGTFAEGAPFDASSTTRSQFW